MEASDSEELSIVVSLKGRWRCIIQILSDLKCVRYGHVKSVMTHRYHSTMLLRSTVLLGLLSNLKFSDTTSLLQPSYHFFPSVGQNINMKGPLILFFNIEIEELQF